MGYFAKKETQPARFSARKRVSPKTHTPDRQLHISGRRCYSPELGRWVSRDPIGEQGGVNVYGFVRNSPDDGVDPIGQQSLDYVTTKKTIGNCGGFEWYVRFNIAPRNSSWPWSWGNIVQHIQTEGSVKACAYGRKVDFEVFNLEDDFYESFKIGSGDDSFSYDYWGPANNDMDGFPATWGSLKVNGSAAYYYRFAYDDGDLDSRNHAHQPPPQPPDSPTTVREIFVEWDCCCGTKETEVTGSGPWAW